MVKIEHESIFHHLTNKPNNHYLSLKYYVELKRCTIIHFLHSTIFLVRTFTEKTRGKLYKFTTQYKYMFK